MRSSSKMTIDASSMSWCSRASSVRSSVLTTRSRPPSACTSRSRSSSWKCSRPPMGTTRSLPESATDVVLGHLLTGIGEDLLGGVDLDQVPRPTGALDIEERRHVARTAGLLHVVGHDHDGVLLLELADQLLDRERGDRVQGGGGLVHQQHVRLDGDRARDAQALLLATGQADARLAEAVLDLLPEVRTVQGALHDLVQLVVLHAPAVELQAGRDVVVD